ncbi:predicted protein [Botrytis cinerea T4]|uniref:Uncharacterized protein n=1 Tax=Botryotinia fuckeliana (strain T4) TaxID=999810 RepID=G2YE87_BOTF4|nr:predicted protein [Botrytis cinerea T4]
MQYIIDHSNNLIAFQVPFNLLLKHQPIQNIFKRVQ